MFIGVCECGAVRSILISEMCADPFVDSMHRPSSRLALRTFCPLALAIEHIPDRNVVVYPCELMLHPKYHRVGIWIRTGQEGIGNSSHGLRTAYRDRATAIVGARLGSTDSAAPDDPGPSTGADWESARAAAEKDNLGDNRNDKQSEGNKNARSCEPRSRNRSGVVSRGTAQRNNTTSRVSLYRRRRLEGPRRYRCTPWSGDTRGHATTCILVIDTRLWR